MQVSLGACHILGLAGPCAQADFLKIDFEREREIDLLFYLFMRSLIASYMCPDQGLNLQLWWIGMML